MKVMTWFLNPRYHLADMHAWAQDGRWSAFNLRRSDFHRDRVRDQSS